MNTVMYHMQPYYPSDMNIDVPDVMYKMRSYHEQDSAPQEQQHKEAHAGGVEEEFALLVGRQEEVLRKLEGLEREVALLGQQGGGCCGTAGDDGGELSGLHQLVGGCAGPVEVVVQASPHRPPLGPCILYDLLCRHQRHTAGGASTRIATACTMYLHSSLGPAEASPKLEAVRAMVGRCNHDNGALTRHRAQLRLVFTIVWKLDGATDSNHHEQPVMLISPHQRTSVRGEANIVRFLSSLLADSTRGKDAVAQTLVDDWLEVITRNLLLTNDGSSQRDDCLRHMQAAVTKATTGYLVPTAQAGPTSADLLAYSAIRQLGVSVNKYKGLKAWLGKIRDFLQTPDKCQLTEIVETALL